MLLMGYWVQVAVNIPAYLLVRVPGAVPHYNIKSVEVPTLPGCVHDTTSSYYICTHITNIR